MKKESILLFYLKIQCSLLFYEKLNKPSFDKDNSTISWKSGKKVFNIKEIDLYDALKKIYWFMKLKGYNLIASKHLKDTWICSSVKNSYTVQLLDNTDLSCSCSCPRYAYKQEDCKHILMLQSKLIQDGHILKLNDLS